MKLIKAIVRPSKVEAIKDELANNGIAGMTVLDVRGCGRQKGHKTVYRGNEYFVNLINKTMLEIVVNDEDVQLAIEAILRTGATGEIGDGKIFVTPVEAEYTIRTGEKNSMRRTE